MPTEFATGIIKDAPGGGMEAVASPLDSMSMGDRRLLLFRWWPAVPLTVGFLDMPSARLVVVWSSVLLEQQLRVGTLLADDAVLDAGVCLALAGGAQHELLGASLDVEGRVPFAPLARGVVVSR